MENEDKILRFSETLRPFLPKDTEYYVAKFIIENVVHFTVSKARSTKLGDYKQPWEGKPHRISVNGNLNQYAFLVTTIHEMAHLTTFEKFRNKAKPHGEEWKNEFVDLFSPIMEREILPSDVTIAVANYLKSAKAASCSDDKLYRVLRRYDKNQGILVEHLPDGAKFELKGKIFQRGKKLRKRYECMEVSTKKMYRVLGVAEIEKRIEDE